MKKLLTLLILPFIFLACSKESTPDPEPSTVLHDVSFNVSTFTNQITDLNTKATINVNGMAFIEYFVFNESGLKIKSIRVDSTQSNFGIIKDKLPSGNYKIFIYASSDISTWVVESSPPFWLVLSGSADVFIKSFDITVGDASIDMDLSLARIVGRLDVVVSDILPTNVSKISVSVDKAANYYFFSGPSSTYFTNTVTQNFENFATLIGTKNNVFSLYLIGMTESTSTVSITAYDATGDIVATKQIPNVGVYTNKKTILTGKLFDETTKNGSFSLSINRDWPADNINLTY